MSDLASTPAHTITTPLTAPHSRLDVLPVANPFLLELNRQGIFLRLLRVELYARSERTSEWWSLREPGSVEWAAGRFRLTVSWPFVARGIA